jgi:signal transduction histidine kinase
MAFNKNIEIINQLNPSTYASCDEQMTSTVIRNLLSNAIKFTPGNAVISLSERKYNSMIEIQVTDQGVGIAQDKLPFLFRIDKNISTKGTANEKGTGLGLVLCKELIEKQGGKIWAQSEAGKGSRFYFTLANA